MEEHQRLLQTNNAIQDGYGIPDVVQLEYYALRQYAVSSQLVPITGRTEGYVDFYTPGTWASVQLNGWVYGLPMDSGPMTFYNNSVFEQVGVDASRSAHGTTTTRPPN